MAYMDFVGAVLSLKEKLWVNIGTRGVLRA